jgi:GNAT superfamily N-acetyltransferase
VRIRETRIDELAELQRIELAAGQLFREVGMPDIAEHPLPPIATLAAYQQAGRSWVVVGEKGPAGFVLVKLVDGLAHIEQISIDPAYARRRVGAGLIDHVESWAAAGGRPALTLSTFRQVPWNAPYYARLGFRELSPAELGPELAELMAEEAHHGLDPADRVAMRRPI